MLSTSVHVLAAVLALATLAAVAAGLPAAGSFGSPALETTAAIALHLQFGALSLVWLVTAPFWRRELARFRDSGWPSLRAMAWFAPAATLAQIALGAAYRYGLAGVIPHVTWAFAAAILLLMFGSFVLTQSGAPQPLKHAATALVSITGVQVVLGVMALLYRVAKLGGGWMEWASRGHMGAGALVLGLTVILAAFVLRCAEPASQTESLASNGTNA
jgi:heme A synthase